MIVFTAQMWPHGNIGEAFELLSGSITNQGRGTHEKTFNYGAHLITRPDPFQGIRGFDADIAVTDHMASHGLAPLLAAVIDCAALNGHKPATLLSRTIIENLTDFQKQLKGRG